MAAKRPTATALPAAAGAASFDLLQ